MPLHNALQNCWPRAGVVCHQKCLIPTEMQTTNSGDPSVWQKVQWPKQQREGPGATWHDWIMPYHHVFDQMTYLPPWISQRKENIFSSFCWHLIWYVWFSQYLYKTPMHSHPASCSLFLSLLSHGKIQTIETVLFYFPWESWLLSSPCQKYSSMDLEISCVNAPLQKVGLLPFLDGKAKVLLGLTLFLVVSFCWCWLTPWAFCFNEASLALHWNWRSLVSLVWLINHSLLTVIWDSSKYRKPWENN